MNRRDFLKSILAVIASFVSVSLLKTPEPKKQEDKIQASSLIDSSSYQPYIVTSVWSTASGNTSYSVNTQYGWNDCYPQSYFLR